MSNEQERDDENVVRDGSGQVIPQADTGGQSPAEKAAEENQRLQDEMQERSRGSQTNE